MILQQIDNIELFDNSDATMVADEAFNLVLEQIRNSKLNFQLQMSPFSAWISLKKSFIKNKDGTPITSVTKSNSDEILMLKDKNRSLEISFRSLQDVYHRTLKDHAKALEIIESLQTQVRDKTNQDTKNDVLQKKNEFLEDSIKERDLTILSLKSAEVTSQQVASKLNKAVVENKIMFFCKHL